MFIPWCSIRWIITAGSMLPERLGMIRPSVGVMPMVGIDRAAVVDGAQGGADAQVAGDDLELASGRASTSAAFSDT